MRSLTRGLPLAAAVTMTLLAFTGSASAQTGNPFGCTASGVSGSVLGAPLSNSTEANPAVTPCASETESTASTTTLPDGLGSVGPTESQTTLDTSTFDGATVYTEATASSEVDDIDLTQDAVPIVGAGSATATVSYQCVNNALVASSSSTLNTITVDGTTYDPEGQPATYSLPDNLGEVLVNQNASTSSSDTETLVEVVAGGSVVSTVGEAEVTTTQVLPCLGTSSVGGTTSGSGSGSGSGGGSSVEPCPSGSVLIGSSCEIPGTTTTVPSSSSGDITGGTVIPLAAAQELYSSQCLLGSGPAYAVVGTEGPDTITVENVRARVLGLGGNDTITVKSGTGTCVDGGPGNDKLVDKSKGMAYLYGQQGNDTITAANGPVRIYGGPGNDKITAGNGKDWVSAGAGSDKVTVGNGNDKVYGETGNDTIVAGNGNDRLYGEQGNDVITYGKGHDHVAAGPGNNRLIRK